MAALGLALSGPMVVGLVPLTAHAATPTPAVSRIVRPCAASNLDVHKGVRQGAAGTFYLRVAVTNQGARRCATPGWTRYRFFNRNGLIGFRSRRNPGYSATVRPVVIGAGKTVHSALSWVDTGVVPRHACHPRHARGARMSIAGVSGHFRLHHLHTRVCTTKRYRPNATRLH